MFSLSKITQCGGYATKQMSTKPLKKVDGKITKLLFSFFNNDYKRKGSQQSYNVNIDDNKLIVSITPDHWHNAFKYNLELNDTKRDKIDTFFKESGLLEFNNYDVIVNGLPQTIDCTCYAEFSSGEKCYFSFNGGHYIAGMIDSILKFTKKIESFTDFDPSKCSDRVPPVNPYIGTHKFLYQNGDKSETYIITIGNSSRDGNSEIVMFGDFGNEHIRANASRIHGAKDMYYISILNYFDDSEEKTNNKGDLGAIMYYKNDTLTLEPLRIGKNLPEKIILDKQTY